MSLRSLPVHVNCIGPVPRRPRPINSRRRRTVAAVLEQSVSPQRNRRRAKRRRHDANGAGGQRKLGHYRDAACRACRRRRVCAAWLGHCEHLRDRSPGRLDHRRHRRLDAGGYRDARGAGGIDRPQDKGGGHPPHPLALRRRDRRVARRRRGGLGTRIPGPQPQHFDRDHVSSAPPIRQGLRSHSSASSIR